MVKRKKGSKKGSKKARTGDGTDLPTKPADDDSGSSGDESAADAQDVSKANQEVLDVDFELFEPDSEDFHNVRGFLSGGTWEFLDLNFSEMADAIVEQGNIGNVVKCHADDVENVTCCGLLTALNLRQFQSQSWPKTIRQALAAQAKKHASSETATALEALLEKRSQGTEVGLIVSERSMNLPPELFPALYKALQDDIEWSCTTPECPEDERPFYFFSHFLCVVKCLGTGESRQAERKAKKAASAPPAGEVTYSHGEVEYFLKRAQFSFGFPVQLPSKEGVESGGQKTYVTERRVAFVITRKAFAEAQKEIAALFEKP